MDSRVVSLGVILVTCSVVQRGCWFAARSSDVTQQEQRLVNKVGVYARTSENSSADNVWECMRTEKDVCFVDHHPFHVREAHFRPAHNPLPPAWLLALAKFLVPPVPARHLEQFGGCVNEDVHSMA
jgi:hypothetical protein